VRGEKTPAEVCDDRLLWLAPEARKERRLGGSGGIVIGGALGTGLEAAEAVGRLGEAAFEIGDVRREDVVGVLGKSVGLFEAREARRRGVGVPGVVGFVGHAGHALRRSLAVARLAPMTRIRTGAAAGRMIGAVVLLSGGAAWAREAAARSEAGVLDATPARFQPEDASERAEVATATPAPLSRDGARVEYARADSHAWTIGGGVAYDGDEAIDGGVFGAYSYFLEDGVEFSGELGGLYLSNPETDRSSGGPEALGLNASMIFRWHFVRTERWTVYADFGIGLMGTTEEIPGDGTDFNFTPRAGAGVTRRITDGGVRLQAGVRWAHISNARIKGDDDNPSRDSAMLYVALVFPF